MCDLTRSELHPGERLKQLGAGWDSFKIFLPSTRAGEQALGMLTHHSQIFLVLQKHTTPYAAFNFLNGKIQDPNKTHSHPSDVIYHFDKFISSPFSL